MSPKLLQTGEVLQQDAHWEGWESLRPTDG